MLQSVDNMGAWQGMNRPSHYPHTTLTYGDPEVGTCTPGQTEEEKENNLILHKILKCI